MSNEKEFKGSNGTVFVQPNKVVLKYSLFAGGGKGKKEIRIKSITGIQLKKPSVTAGYIQIVFPGSSEQKGRSTFAATKDENTIMVSTKSQYEKMVQAKELIEHYQDSIDDHFPQPSTSVTDTSNLIADELRKLADLRDAGILTDEELTQQKMKLLKPE